MKIDVRGDKGLPKILLIHSSIADSRCFEPLFPYLEEFCLLLPTLGGHNITDSSIYTGAKSEAEALIAGLESMGISSLHAMCGESLGCVVAWEVLLTRKLEIRKTVFDGAPFARSNFPVRLLNYLLTMRMVKQCRKNPDRLKAADEMYPQVADSIKQVIAHYTGKTARNVINDAMGGVKIIPNAVTEKDRLVVMYGENDPYIRGMEFFKNAGYPFTAAVMKGYGHCDYLLKSPEDFCKMITE